VAALAVPELILLHRVLKPPLLAAFVSVTGLGILLIGYLLNALLVGSFSLPSMDIKILGSGCKTCISLDDHARMGAAELGLVLSLEAIDDPAAIAASGVMRTPALVIDGQVVVSGRVPTADAVRSLLSKASTD
jgi:hypothetical protein